MMPVSLDAVPPRRRGAATPNPDATPTPPPAATPAPGKPASDVVRLAPDFSWEGSGGKAYSVRKFRGQPVVVLIANSPNNGSIRQQAERIQKLYLQFSAKKTVFITAYTAENGRVGTNVPFVLAQNGPTVAAAFGATGKELTTVVIGPDGNVDMKAEGVLGAQRILDIINNNYQIQAVERVNHGG